MRRAGSRRIRIGIVCDQLGLGGQEVGMLDLVRCLDRKRFAPSVYAFRDGPLRQELTKIGVPAFASHRRAPLDGRWTKADAASRTAFRRHLAEMLRRDRIDVCLVYAWPDAIPAAREAGVPAIVERLDGPMLVGRIRDKSSCTLIICQSHAIQRLMEAQRDLLRFRGIPIAMVRNGVDLDRFDPSRYDRSRCRRALRLEDDELVIGTIARLVPRKNVGHLLDAARVLIDRFGQRRRIRVVIAGPDGGAGKNLMRQARELGLGDRVQFLGPRRDVPELLRAFDVFVLPSIQEGVSFAILEAMAMGVPVVATQSDSIAETVGDAGYLVTPLDPYPTTRALHELLEDPALRQELGRRGRRIVRRHDLALTVRKYEQLLASAFRREKRRPAAFRRRIVVMPGHIPDSRGAHRRAVEILFDEMARRGLDVYSLPLTPEDGKNVSQWPPARREKFENTLEGYRSREWRLRWIAPDVVITDCPRVAAQVRSILGGEEILFMPEPRDVCPGYAAGVRAADRVVVPSAAERASLVRRFPAQAWKISELRPRGAGAIVSLLAKARPRP